jgi:hypothetical protein
VSVVERAGAKGSSEVHSGQMIQIVISFPEIVPQPSDIVHG